MAREISPQEHTAEQKIVPRYREVAAYLMRSRKATLIDPDFAGNDDSDVYVSVTSLRQARKYMESAQQAMDLNPPEEEAIRTMPTSTAFFLAIHDGRHNKPGPIETAEKTIGVTPTVNGRRKKQQKVEEINKHLRQVGRQRDIKGGLDFNVSSYDRFKKLHVKGEEHLHYLLARTTEQEFPAIFGPLLGRKLFNLHPEVGLLPKGYEDYDGYFGTDENGELISLLNAKQMQERGYTVPGAKAIPHHEGLHLVEATVKKALIESGQMRREAGLATMHAQPLVATEIIARWGQKKFLWSMYEKTGNELYLAQSLMFDLEVMNLNDAAMALLRRIDPREVEAEIKEFSPLFDPNYAEGVIPSLADITGWPHLAATMESIREADRMMKLPEGVQAEIVNLIINNNYTPQEASALISKASH